MALATKFRELVPENLFVRTVSKTEDELDIEKIFAKNTKGSGASRYHPIMLMKVLIYCYMTGIYSSRMVAKQCPENINVMRLTGFQKPDFRTINTLRSEEIKEEEMLNGQLKPGYNIQTGTENNFVIGYDVFPNPTDTKTLIPNLENVKKRLNENWISQKIKVKELLEQEEYKELISVQQNVKLYSDK